MWKYLGATWLFFVIGVGPTTAQQCDFLAPDYFTRPEFVADSSLCLQQGYTFGIRTRGSLDTPLHLAVRKVDDPLYFDQLAILIPDAERQELVALPNADEFNPFHLAVQSDLDPRIIVRLSKWGDVVNSMTKSERSYLVLKQGTTGLHLATVSKAGRDPNVKMIITLLAVGADPKIEDAEGNRAFDYARGASNVHDVALLLEPDVWLARVKSTFESSEVVEEKPVTENAGCDSFLSSEFFVGANPEEIWSCTAIWANGRDDSKDLWSLRTRNGDNALHLALKADVSRDQLNALLAAAEWTEGLDAALSSKDANGLTPLHVAAKHSSDPLALVALARWGSDVDALANATSNGVLKGKTGTSALHIAAKREDSEYFVAALLAVGATPYVYDNNSEGNMLEEAIGMTPLDYLSQSQSLNAMALITPNFSLCEVVSNNTEKFAAVVGLGAGATGTAAMATSGLGITAVTHSSGAVILTGSSGYIAGTLGALGSSALAFLTAPLTLSAAAVSVVAVGGTVYYCSSDD